MSITVNDKERIGIRSKVTARVLKEQIKKFQESIDNLARCFELYKEQSQKNCNLRNSSKSRFSNKNEVQKIRGKSYNYRGINKRPEKILKKRKLRTSSFSIDEPEYKFCNLNNNNLRSKTYDNIGKKNSDQFIETIYKRKIINDQYHMENKNNIITEKSNKNNNCNDKGLFDNCYDTKNINLDMQQNKCIKKPFHITKNNGSLQKKTLLYSGNTLITKRIEHTWKDFKINNHYKQNTVNANNSLINKYGERRINQTKAAQKTDNTKKTFYCVVNSPCFLAQKSEWKWKSKNDKDKTNIQPSINCEESKNDKSLAETTSEPFYADNTETKKTDNKITQTEQLDLLAAKCKFIDFLLNLLRKNSINACCEQNRTPDIDSKSVNPDLKKLNNSTGSSINENLQVGLKESFLKCFSFNKRNGSQTLDDEELMSQLNAGKHYSNNCCISTRSIGINTDNKQINAYRSYHFQTTSKQVNKNSQRYLKDHKNSLANPQQICNKKSNYKRQEETINEHKFGPENRINKIYNWEQKNNFKLGKSLKSTNVLQGRREYKRPFTTKYNYPTNINDKKQTGTILKQCCSSDKLIDKTDHGILVNDKNDLNETVLGPIKNQAITQRNKNIYGANPNDTINSGKNNCELKNDKNNGKEFINKNILLTKSINLNNARKGEPSYQSVNHDKEKSNQTSKTRFHNICRSKILQAVSKVSKLNMVQNMANQNNKSKHYTQNIHENKTKNSGTHQTRILSKETNFNLSKKLSKYNIRNFSTIDKPTIKLNDLRPKGIYSNINKKINLSEQTKCKETNIKKNAQNTETLPLQQVPQKRSPNANYFTKTYHKNLNIRKDLCPPLNSSELKKDKHTFKTEKKNELAMKNFFEELDNENISPQIMKINNDKNSVANANNSLQENVTINIIMNNQNYDKRNINMVNNSQESDLSETSIVNEVALTRREKSSKDLFASKNNLTNRLINQEPWKLKEKNTKQFIKGKKINPIIEDKKINTIRPIKNNKHVFNETILKNSHNHLSYAFKRSDENIFEIHETDNEVLSKNLSYNSDSSKSSDDISGVWLNNVTNSLSSLEYSNSDKNIKIITNNSYKPSNENLCWKSVRYHDAEIINHNEPAKRKSFLQFLKSWFH